MQRPGTYLPHTPLPTLPPTPSAEDSLTPPEERERVQLDRVLDLKPAASDGLDRWVQRTRGPELIFELEKCSANGS
eukprot:3054943-Pleurochrysis_carterae.AAC.1